jgi:ATP-binding cassette subfamily B protein
MRSQTLDQLRQLFRLLPPQRLRAVRALLPFSLLPGVLDLVCVWLVARLTGSLVNSGLPGVAIASADRHSQSLWLITLFVVFCWLASAAKLGLRFRQQRLSARIWKDLSDLIYRRLLHQPFVFHLSAGSAELSARLLTNSHHLAANVITPILQLVSGIASIVLLSLGIIWIGRWVSVALVLGLVVAYVMVSVSVTPRLRTASGVRLQMEGRSAQQMLESMHSIRDIQITSSEIYFQRLFARSTEQSRQSIWIAEWLPELPRGLIEPLGITMIFAVGALPALLSGNPERVQEILPFLATISVASLRLTPPLQDAFRALTRIRGSLPLLTDVVDLLRLPADRPTLLTAGVPSAAGVAPRHFVRLRDVWFRYAESHDWVLKGVNLTIPVGARVALVGLTGSGKSTTANLLLGLLTPQTGSLELDGIPVDDLELPAWQASCAHVPQAIHLLSASILENVAFGEPLDHVDEHQVWEALEAAQLQDFVAQLPSGLHTQVGENGLRLSGGQRQRLALARAFYRRSGFLVLDEATSALDNRTESEVIDALELVGRRCTTVVVAHRLSTVRRCDRIVELENGVVKAYGSFDELQRDSPAFDELVRLEDQDQAMTGGWVAGPAKEAPLGPAS